MLSTPWMIIIGIIALASGAYWLVLRNQIKTEDLESRVEPNLAPALDEEFALFDAPNPYERHRAQKAEEESTQRVSVSSMEIADTVAQQYGAFEDAYQAMPESLDQPFETLEDPKTLKENSPPKAPATNLDIFEDVDVQLSEVATTAPHTDGLFSKLKNIFKRVPVSLPDPREALASLTSPGNRAMARPAPVRTVALILKAPEDQPYLGQEVLEIAMEMNLMVGREGFLEHMTTTYFGDEPMYSIAHMFHPGSFNESGILAMELPGLVFFAHIPGPDPDMETIDYLIKAAAKFGHALGGTLLNEYQEPVDRDYLEKLYKEISALDKETWAQMLAYHDA